MKDKDQQLIFEKYQTVCEGPIDFGKKVIKGVGNVLIPSVTPGSAHAGILSFAKGATAGSKWGIPNIAGMGANLGSGLAAGQQGKALQKAVQAGQITQQGAAQMMASAKPKDTAHADASNNIPSDISVDGYLKESMVILEDFIELKNGKTSKL